MSTKHRTLPRLGACTALMLTAAIGCAAAVPAQATGAPPAPPAATADAAAGEAQAGVFTMKIGRGDDAATDGGKEAHGVVITVGGDEDEHAGKAEMAGRVVDRVVDELEAALADMPEQVRKELDDEDMRELRRALGDIRELREPRQVVSRRESDEHPWANVIPGIAAIVLLFGGPVVIVAIVSYNNRRKRELVHQTIDRVIEQGRDVPGELLEALDKGRSDGRTALSRGMVNVALGVGTGAALYNLSGFDVATLGLIPLCIGIAQITVWAIERRPADTGTAVR
jgi:hypothetical protein